MSCCYTEGMRGNQRYISIQKGGGTICAGEESTYSTHSADTGRKRCRPSIIVAQTSRIFRRALWRQLHQNSARQQEGGEEHALGLLLYHRIISAESQKAIEWDDSRNQPTQP
jgi:hypothetical protein